MKELHIPEEYVQEQAMPDCLNDEFTAYIGLGANLGHPEAALRRAVHALRQLPCSRVSGISQYYRSAPLGPPDQPDYWNAALRLETRLTPHALLTSLHDIENQNGRLRAQRWGARTLDLDLLLYGNDIIQTSSLIVPHPELKNRNFVVIPLLDIDPGLTLPDGAALASLPAAHDWQGLCVTENAASWRE